MPSTTTITAFAELGVADDLCACLTQRGRTEPFPIQATAIPPAIAGNDVFIGDARGRLLNRQCYTRRLARRVRKRFPALRTAEHLAAHGSRSRS